MSIDIQQYSFGDPGSDRAAQERLKWAHRRVRVVAMCQVLHGVPYHIETVADGGRAALLLPYAGTAVERIEAAAADLRKPGDPTELRVANVDASGFPLDEAPKPWRVLLATRGNPDLGQDPSCPPWGMPPDRFIVVESLQEGREAVRRFIVNNDVGGGQWVGGDAWQGGRRLGRFAYNGRYFSSSCDSNGTPSVEFAERIHPGPDAVAAALRKAGFTDDQAEGAEVEVVQEFPLSRFAGERTADQWRVWYAEEVGRAPRLGARTMAPLLDPVVSVVRDDEAHAKAGADEWSIGAAFTRGDEVIPAIVFHAPRPKLVP